MRLPARRPSPLTWSAIIIGLIAAAVIIYAMLRMLLGLFFRDGRLDLTAFATTIQLPGIGLTVLNTFGLVAVGGGAALLLGSVLAWLNERTNARMGWVSNVLPVLPLLIPGIAMSIGWVMLLSPRAGLINTLVRDIFHLDMTEGPLNIFTWWGLAFIYTIELVPYVYLSVSSALRNLDPSLEEASRMSGSGTIATLMRVTMPAVKPALASGLLLVVVIGLAMYSAPAIIGTTARVDVLSSRIVQLQVGSYPPQTAEAIVLGSLMLLLVGSAWWVQSRVVRQGRYGSIGGKGVRASRVRLRGWRWPARALILGYVFAATVLPIVALAWVSVQKYWTSTFDIANLTVGSFAQLLESSGIRQALINSVLLAVTGATVGMLATFLIAIFVVRRSTALGRFIDGVTKLPAGLPHVVIGIGLVVAFSGAPFFLGGTLAILLLAYVVIYLPQASVVSTSSVSQIGGQLIEASHIAGAGAARTLRKILLPLALPALAGGWAILFVLMSGELTASVLLAGSTTRTAGVMLLDLWVSGTYPLIAALALLITTVSTIVVMSVLRLTRGKIALNA